MRSSRRLCIVGTCVCMLVVMFTAVAGLAQATANPTLDDVTGGWLMTVERSQPCP
jgi:hypothetical protein